MQKTFTFRNNDTNTALSQALEYIHEHLADLKLKPKDINRAELMCEESLASLLKHAGFSDTGAFTVNVSKSFPAGNVNIKLTVPGQEFAFTGGVDDVFSLNSDDFSPEAAESIRNMLLRSFSQYIKYKHSGNYNIITIRAIRSSFSRLYVILGALVSAAACGLLMRAFLPEGVCMLVSNNIFEPVRNIFINGLKLCAIPLVFLSLMSCMADTGNMSGIKRTGCKILVCLLTTQIIALMIAFGVTLVFRPGEGAGLVMPALVNTEVESVSMVKTLVNVIPSDIVRPFLDGNMLQLIAIAVILGVSAGLSGAKSVMRSLSELNGIFTKAMEIFLKMIPLVMFCSIASMVITTGTSTIFSVLGMVMTILAGYVLLHLMYILMVKFIARTSPAKVYKISAPALVTSMATCSSTAALPEAIKAAENLGIPSRIYSFALPLGVSAFKNESCIYFVAAVMSAANMYGIHFTAADMLFLGVYAFIAALSTPSTPYGGIIMLSVILADIGCPLEFVPLFMAVDTITDMFATLTICIQSIAAAVVVSSLEKEPSQQ